jgi:hypothetical protein
MDVTPAFHDDLLELAFQLCRLEPGHLRQACLRRAVSTAYYALFHLLISDTVENWRESDLRSTLGRSFDHQQMKTASNRVSDPRIFRFAGEDTVIVDRLRFVARAFANLQQQRHIADYDNARVWDSKTTLTQVDLASQAFTAWNSIRTEKIAQAYLLSLLVRNR